MATVPKLYPPGVNLEGLHGPYQRGEIVDLSAADYDCTADVREVPGAVPRGFVALATGTLAIVTMSQRSATPLLLPVVAGTEYRWCVRKIVQASCSAPLQIAAAVLLGF